MTTYKGHMLPIDREQKTAWAIASLRSVGVGIGPLGGSATVFDLVNRHTQRAHRLKVFSGGAGLSLPVSGSFSSSDYANFYTRRPANFEDFNGKAVQIGSVNALVYSKTHLEIRDGSAASDPILADVTMSGWGPNIPSTGSERGHTEVLYTSDGKPVDIGGVMTLPPDLDLPTLENLDVRVQITLQDDSLVIKLQGDALFDFDKSNIKPEADRALKQAGAIIRSYRVRRVDIDGHTDSVGDDGYNLELSDRRAKAVAQWLISHRYLKGGSDVQTKGWGKSKPVAPNTRPDGSDDPAGRAKNRRVELFLIKR